MNLVNIFRFSNLIIILTTVIITYFALNYLNNKESKTKPKKANITKAKKSDNIGSDLLELSEAVSFKSQNLIWVIKDNSAEAEKLAYLFEDIARAVENNAASIEEISATIEELSASSELINKETDKVSQFTENALEISKENKKWIEESASTLIELSENVNGSAQSIKTVDKALQNTTQLLKGIKDITDQINLLALNASIEAARAGQAGRGFKVVAGEIKKLSGETEKLTEEISEAISQMKLKLNNTEEIISEGIENIAGVEELAAKSVKSFSEMSENLKKVVNSTAKLSNNTENQAEAARQSTKAVESIAEESQLISENITDINNGVRKQSENSSQIYDLSESLTDISYKLHNIAVKKKEENMLIFGVNPFTKPEQVKKLYLPIINKVSELAARKAKTIIVPDYESLLDYMGEGLIDFAWFSPMAYVQAKAKLEIIPLVTPKINGKASYNGYIFSRKDSQFQQLSELHNSSFAFVDKLSASGYIYPKYLLKEAGIEVERDLKEIAFLGNHDKVIKSVINSNFDAGASYNEAWERAAKAGLNLDSLKIIKKTEAIPKDVIAANSSIESELRKTIQNAFLNVSTKKDIKEALNQTNITDFIKTEDQNFDVIRKYQL